jgi:inosine-uridine nucleoside N-ribohydrolase
MAIACVFATGHRAQAQAPPRDADKMKMILDTDIGDDIDDVYALALAATRPNVQLLGVTTAWGHTRERAELAAKFLKVIGRTDVPVYAGRRGEFQIKGQYAWAKGFTSRSMKRETAVAFLKRTVDLYPGEVTIVAIGPLVNLGDLLTRYPDVKAKIKRIVIMGGAVHVGYNNQAPNIAEWNIKCDPVAAKIVYTSGVPLFMAGLEVTTMMKIELERQNRIYACGTPLTDALSALTHLWGSPVPTLYDPVAVAYAMGEAHCDEERMHVVVDPDGLTRITEGPPNCTVLINPHKDAFLDWYVEAIAESQKKALGSRQ